LSSSEVSRSSIFAPDQRLRRFSVFKYTGQLAVPELGLYYYKSRFYAPRIGRFLQPDPAGYRGGMHLYPYAMGDPVNLIDPDGTWPFCFTATLPTLTTINPWGNEMSVVSESRNLCFELPDWIYGGPSLQMPSGGDASGDSPQGQQPAPESHALSRAALHLSFRTTMN
jgi:RHS repeat-associated protein